MTNKKVLIELHYLPSIAYFSIFHRYKNIEIESCENFVKRSYRNRTYILSSNKINHLSIPVVRGNSKKLIKEVQIDNTQRWVDIHWRSILSAYGKAPFFEYYADYFYEILYKKHEFLFDLNLDLLILCLKLLNYDNVITFSQKYQKESQEDVLDLRSQVNEKKTNNKSIFYQPYSYIQLFGKEFVPNLSIIDLLFCEGQNAGNIIDQSTATE